MIKENINYFLVKMMCRLLLVSASGYYDWRDRPPSKRTQENVILAAKIKVIFDEEYSRSGAKRIAKRLKLDGTPASRHRIARIIRANG